MASFNNLLFSAFNLWGAVLSARREMLLHSNHSPIGSIIVNSVQLMVGV
jgi:hypothetical protein